MFRNISKYVWFSFIPLVTSAMIVIALFATGHIPYVYLFATLLGWAYISGLGTAIGYHRVFSHNTHPNLSKWKENIILLAGALSGQGSSITWVAIHRGYHHRYSDKIQDLHSPMIKGKWHAFIGWTMAITESNNPINLKYSVDLLRKPNHVWFHEHCLQILWIVPILVALIDWKLALAGLILPAGLSLLQDNFVNVYGHQKAIIGYRTYDTDDNSHNNVLLGWFGWGQGWHNNHHYNMNSFNLGSGISGKWWEFDPCILFLPFLGKAR